MDLKGIKLAGKKVFVRSVSPYACKSDTGPAATLCLQLSSSIVPDKSTLHITNEPSNVFDL